MLPSETIKDFQAIMFKGPSNPPPPPLPQNLFHLAKSVQHYWYMSIQLIALICSSYCAKHVISLL